MARKPAPRKRMMKEKKEFEEEVLQIDRVTRVVKGGRRLSFRATVIIGNRKGKVALGLGKASEVTSAIQKAVTRAKKNIITVPIIKETIPHEIKVKYKANRLLMIPAKPGTGIKAGSSTRKILELVGIKNILAKRMGSSNRINLAKATMKALEYFSKSIKTEEKKQAPKKNAQQNNRQGQGPNKPAAKQETKKEAPTHLTIKPKQAEAASEKAPVGKKKTDEIK